jgi:hypothetical protein
MRSPFPAIVVLLAVLAAGAPRPAGAQPHFDRNDPAQVAQLQQHCLLIRDFAKAFATRRAAGEAATTAWPAAARELAARVNPDQGQELENITGVYAVFMAPLAPHAPAATSYYAVAQCMTVHARNASISLTSRERIDAIDAVLAGCERQHPDAADEDGLGACVLTGLHPLPVDRGPGDAPAAQAPAPAARSPGPSVDMNDPVQRDRMLGHCAFVRDVVAGYATLRGKGMDGDAAWSKAAQDTARGRLDAADREKFDRAGGAYRSLIDAIGPHAARTIGQYGLVQCAVANGKGQLVPTDTAQQRQAIDDVLARCEKASADDDALGACVVDGLTPLVR